MAKFLERLWAVVRRKELMGKDYLGNAFFRHSTTVDGAAEWYSWLTGRRKDAPTSEEIMALEAYRKRVKLNAAIVEKEEEKRRFRQTSLQQDANLDEIKPPEMSKFIQQVAALEGVSIDGEDKASMKTSAEETPSIEETSRTIDDSLQGSGKGGQDGEGAQRCKEQVDVFEKWVPPS